MDFDAVLEEIGEFGKYQKKVYFLVCLPILFAGACSLEHVFTAVIPNYRCFIPECEYRENATYYERWVVNAIPDVGGSSTGYQPAHCKRYDPVRAMVHSKVLHECPSDLFTRSVIYCNDWVFDNSERSIVQEWKITCFQNEWKLALVGTVHFAGLILGASIFGFFADKWGRKYVLIFCAVTMGLGGVLIGLAWNYNSFMVFTLLNAISTSGVYPTAFVMGIEMVGAKKREMVGVILNFFYAFGGVLVGVVAYFCRYWRYIQFFICTPPIVFFIYIWILPESARWHLNKKRFNQATKIIRRMAIVNGRALSDDKIEALIAFYLNSDRIKKKTSIMATLKQIMHSRILIKRYGVVLYIWVADFFIFYGLSMASTILHGNKYIIFMLVCLAEIPGYILAWIVLNKIGRRWPLLVSLLICGITCICSGFLLDVRGSYLKWIIIPTYLIGKLAIACAANITYVLTTEMLPTVVRSCCLGIMLTVGRFGAMAASFAPLISKYYKPLPLVIFGSFALLASILSLMLPETLKKKLPETVEDAEHL